MNQFLTSTLIASAYLVQSSASACNVPAGRNETEVCSDGPQWQATSIEAMPDAHHIKLQILYAITKNPGLDDEEIASQIGIAAFDVSGLLREMEREGLVIGR